MHLLLLLGTYFKITRALLLNSMLGLMEQKIPYLKKADRISVSVGSGMISTIVYILIFVYFVLRYRSISMERTDGRC